MDGQEIIFQFEEDGNDLTISIVEGGVLRIENGNREAVIGVELPRAEIPRLLERLLSIPPVEAVAEAKPLVVYFLDAAGREEFIAEVKSINPGIRTVKL